MSEPKEKTLVVLLNGARMGTLDQDAHGQLSFTYDEDYRQRRSPTPLSLSMPITRRIWNQAGAYGVAFGRVRTPRQSPRIKGIVGS